jgi:hypothetical protein
MRSRGEIDAVKKMSYLLFAGQLSQAMKSMRQDIVYQGVNVGHIEIADFPDN